MPLSKDTPCPVDSVISSVAKVHGHLEHSIGQYTENVENSSNIAGDVSITHHTHSTVWTHCSELDGENATIDREIEKSVPKGLKINKTSFQSNHNNLNSDDTQASYYEEIINFITSKIFPDNCSLSYKMLLKKRAKNYALKEGVLFYGTKRVVQTKCEQIQILKNAHVEEKSGVHLGVKKMSQIINAQCFWRGQYFDIANFVRQCSKCTEIGEPSLTKENIETEQYTEENGVPEMCKIWHNVEVNLHGPFSKNDNQSAYIASIIDPASQFIVARIVAANNCSTDLSYFILDTLCTFGIVKCYFSDTCREYLDSVKLLLSQNECVQKLKLQCYHSIENLMFILPQGQEKCSWFQSCLEPYIKNFLPLCEADLSVFIFELNTKIANSSPFARMFNRKPYQNLQEDKENSDVGKVSQRRLLRSSILQCRHCEEVFTSKISFRIHQRKHTEEAHRRGMLEGQTRNLGDRERRLLRKPCSKYKHIRVKRKIGDMQFNGSNIERTLEERNLSSVQFYVPEHRRAELRASTVEAIRRLVAKVKAKRKRRGKYKKFPSDIQEEMAQYAKDHGNLLTVRHFSEKLGVTVSESTVRNIVKWYQCFTPEIKDEIGRFAATFGVEAAASHFSERLGREVRFGLIRKFKKIYLSGFSDTKQMNSGRKTDQRKSLSTSQGINEHGETSILSSEMKDKIGHYADEHSIPSTIDHFLQQFNLHLTENEVYLFKKMYEEKQKSCVIQSEQTNNNQKQQQNVDQQNQQMSLLQQSLDQQNPAFHVEILQSDLQDPSHTVQQSHFIMQQQQEQQHVHLHQPQQLPQQQQLQHHHDIPQVHTELQHHEPLSTDSNAVPLLSLQHPSSTSDSNLQEANLQSSNQTIDILQTSLNLLNNPQLNNSTAIIYNSPFQMSSTSHVTSNQLVPLNSQHNTPVTFQATSQCNETNIPVPAPIPYPQDVPISASVIINQDVAAVQTFPNPQMYTTFAQTSTGQPTTLAVSDHNLPLPSTGAPMSTLSHHPSPLSNHSGVSITVAVAPLSANPHFQTNNHQPAVVLSQPVPQSILVSHSQTALLQHIINSQPHIQTPPSQLPQHVVSEVQMSSGSVQQFPHIVEQQNTITSNSLGGNIPPVTYETQDLFENESRRLSFTIPENSQCLRRIDNKNGSDFAGQMQGMENQDTLAKIREEPEPILSSSLLDSQGTSLQCCSPPNNVNTECEAIVECNALEKDCLEERKLQEETKVSATKSSGSSNMSSRKSCPKREKRITGKGKVKAQEQKRGTYAIYSPEIRAEMGKYAAEHGSQRACAYFREKHSYNVAESTMRGFRDKYLKKRELCSQDDDSEVTSLGYAPRGRPMRLGQYDEVVQECMQELVRSGEKISSFLAIATAKHVLMQYEPHLLEENGGNIKLNVTWAKSFLKRSGIKNHS